MKPLVIFAFILLPSAALAYIGPGAGISVLGSLLGILGTIVVAIAAILLWPIRKFLKRKKQKNKPDTNDNAPGIENPGNNHNSSSKP